MKKTDLEKNKGQKILGKIQQGGTPARFAGAAPLDRREQRRIDQALGLIPFAVKLNSELVQRVHAHAAAHALQLNDAVAALLAAGLGEERQDAPVNRTPPTKTAAAQSATDDASEPAQHTGKTPAKEPPQKPAQKTPQEAANRSAKFGPTHDAKHDPKADAKQNAKSDATPGAKIDAAPNAKSDAKHGANSEARQSSNTDAGKNAKTTAKPPVKTRAAAKKS